MEYNTFHFKFDELGLTARKISYVMGYENGQAPEPFSGIIDEVLSEASQYADISGGFVIRDKIRFNKLTKNLNIDGIGFDIHPIIAREIKDTEQVALFLCTAGAGIGDWSKQLMKSGDMLTGYVVDIVGSETVEAAMDHIQHRLEKHMEEKNYHISERFSPGYCGWQVSEQQKLFGFFPDQYCGISLSPSSLMDPIKSISGIIGIGKNVKRNGYICNRCDMSDCIYRNKRHVQMN